MICFPNCKINLGLQVVDKRPDGYHDIETVFYPVPFKDALEIIPSKETSLQITGLALPNTTDNLCLKAYELIKKDFPDLPPIKIHLHKAIPAGAGLGGGSADGAFTLKLINDQFDLKINETQLLQYALLLGSDCPFFILNKPALAKGRGEILQEIKLPDLKDYSLVLINPGIHIDTGWAFNHLTIKSKSVNTENVIAQPIEQWKELLSNDFEIPVFESHPEIKKIKELLYNNGAVYASMSGSGSTVYGFFKNEFDEKNVRSTSNFYKKIKL